LPNLAETFAAVLQTVAVERQPLLIAIAERLAAERYRAWAADPGVADHRSDLLACAAREEDIAARVEALYVGAAEIQANIRTNNPGLMEINRTLFAHRPLRQQFAIQAQGERLGAATWRSLARHETDAARSAVLRTCAELEEASALVLEGILGKTVDG
jgi:hypothetical protein